MSITNRLKNCPFCNSKAELIEVSEDDWTPFNDWQVRCTGCGIKQKVHKGEDWESGRGYFKIEDGKVNAIVDWNTRYCSEDVEEDR